MKTYFLILILTVASLDLVAQPIKIALNAGPEPIIAASISPELRNQIILSVEQKLNEYIELGSLLDKSQRRVTSVSIDRFRALFNAAAELPKDYLEFVPTQPVGLSEYCNEVFQRLETRGLQMTISAARLLEIIDDPTGFYVIRVAVDKSLYNYLAEHGGSKISTSGRHFKQIFHFDILKTRPEEVKIANIMGETRPPAADYARYFGPSLAVGLPLVQSTLSDNWNNRSESQGNLSINGGVSFAIGFDYITNRLLPRSAPRKNLFASVGIHLTTSSLSTKLENVSIGEFSAVASTQNDTLAYQRSAQDIQAKEVLTVTSLTIPVGIAWRLKSSRKVDVFVAARLLPSFTLTDWGRLDGEGTYAASIAGASWRSDHPNAVNPEQLDDPSKFGPFIIGQRSLEGSPSPTVAPFTLAIQLSPQAYIRLSDTNPNWSLLLGLDLHYQFKSSIEHEDSGAGDLFQFPDDYSGSILQHYTSGLSLFTPSLRLGLLHRMVTKP